MNYRTKIIYWVFVIMLLSSCSLFQSETDSVVDMLPRDTDVPGWERVDDIVYSSGKDIRRYNREYSGLGIEKLSSAIYKSIDDADIFIKLEVIKFNSAINAYGFFSTRRGPGIFDNSQVNEYYSNSISEVQAGEYVIYSATDKIDLLLKKELKTFVNIPLLYLGKNYNQNRLPESINVLKGSDGFGVLYSARPYHRFPFLQGIHFTQWSWNEDLIDVFFCENKSFYESYGNFKKSIENDYIMLSSDNTYSAFKKEQDGRYTFISVYEKWIYGCWSLSDFNDGKKVLNEIRSRIELYRKNNR